MNETHFMMILMTILVGEMLAIALVVGGRRTTQPPVVVVQPTPSDDGDMGCLLLVLLPALALLGVLALMILEMIIG
jgi:hypothetical protein